MLEGITPLHLLLVLGIALLVVGPGKLPDVGKAFGQTIREFRRGFEDNPANVGATTAPVPPSPAPSAQVAPPSTPVAPPADALVSTPEHVSGDDLAAD